MGLALDQCRTRRNEWSATSAYAGKGSTAAHIIDGVATVATECEKGTWAERCSVDSDSLDN